MGVTGLVVGGFLAEAWNLTLADWKRYHEIYAEANRGRLPLWTIILDPSVHVALEKLAFVQELGYVGPRSSTRSSSSAAMTRSTTGTSTSPTTPTWPSSCTRTPVSGKVLSLELIARLAEIPTIVGVKQGSLLHDDSLRLRRMARADFIVSDPNEYWFLDDLRNGGQVLWGGFEYIIYGKQRHLLREYIDLARAGRWEEARVPWLALRPVYNLLQVTFMDEIAKTASYAGATAVIKAWYEAVGLQAGNGRMLAPVHELPPERKEWLLGQLAEVGVI